MADKRQPLDVKVLTPRRLIFEGKADTLISLSKMTIAHQLVRIVFWEQLYRAATLITGHPYHK